jgi:CDP-diacylglycerol--glycerol-3-phosphate 3-phosphatidyltransferase
LLLLLATLGAPRIWLLIVLSGSMLSDVFDGVIARSLKIVTLRLRAADSFADAWLFGWIGLTVLLIHPRLVAEFKVPLLIEAVLLLGSYGFDLIRYGRIATLHAYSAKLWGLSLYIASVAVLV